MRALPARDVRQALASKGFQADTDKKKKRDHEMFFLVVEGRRSGFFVKISRGATELRLDEIANNARQAGVAPSELFKVLSCELDSNGTLTLYRNRRPQG